MLVDTTHLFSGRRGKARTQLFVFNNLREALRSRIEGDVTDPCRVKERWSFTVGGLTGLQPFALFVFV